MALDRAGFAGRLRAVDANDRRIQALLGLLDAVADPDVLDLEREVVATRARTRWNDKSINKKYGPVLDALEKALVAEFPSWAELLSGFATRLAALVGAKHRNGSRLTPLLDLISANPAPAPAAVIRELQQARTRTHWYTSSVESKYGSVLDQLEGAASRELPLQRRGSFQAHLHVGPENELKAVQVRFDPAANVAQEAWDQYGKRIGRTPATSEVANLPLIDLQVEHMARNTIIEHIGGPISVRDARFLLSRRALAEFLDAANTESAGNWVALDNVLQRYNLALQTLANGHEDFELQEKRYLAGNTAYGWEVKVDPNQYTAMNSQLNFEVPLFSISTPGFAQMHANRDLVDACQQQANLLLTNHLAQARGTLIEPALVLYLMVLATFCYQNYWEGRMRAIGGNQNRRMGAGGSKNLFDFLPKAPVNDIFRVCLPREHRRLLAGLVTGGNWANFRNDLTTSTQTCVSARWTTYDATRCQFDFDRHHQAYLVPGAGARYKGETDHMYGESKLDQCRTMVGQDRCGRPHGHPGPHNAHPSMAESPMTSTGKPLDPLFFDAEPLLVFELRDASSVMLRLAKPVDPLVDETQAAQKLGAVQT